MKNKGFDLRSSGSRRKLKRSLISAFVSLGMVAAVVVPFAPITDVRADSEPELQYMTVGGNPDNPNTGYEYLPIYSLYENSISQQIYTSDELGNPMTIYSIAFYSCGSAITRDFDIYLINTEKTDFSTTTDWETVTADNLVYSGSSNFEPGQWIVLDLDTPFEYTGNNLVLCVDSHNLEWHSGVRCWTSGTNTYQSIIAYRDNTAYDPFNISAGGTLTMLKNIITIGYTPGHIHAFTYAVGEGDAANTITATCTADDCTYTENPTLSIIAPEDLVWDGQVKACTLNEGYDTKAFPDVEIEYYQDDTKIDADDVIDAGDYTAKVTVGEGDDAVTATLDFEIVGTEPDSEVTAKTLFYTGEAQDLLQSAIPVPTGCGTIRYSVNDTNSELALGTEPQGTDVGTYNVYYRVENAPKSNYADQEFSSERYIAVEIAEAPVVTMEDYTYLGEVSTPSVPEAYADEAVFYYNTIESNVDGTEWQDITPTTFDAGEYYMYAVIAETDDHVAFTTDPVRFEVIGAEPAAEVTAKTLFYTGEAQNLLQSAIPVPTICGTLRYSIDDIDNELEPGVEPQQVDAGIYRVYYRVQNDPGANYLDQEFSLDRYIDVEIVDVPVVTMDDYTYGTEVPTPAVTEAYAADATFYYTTDPEVEGTEWTDIEATTLDAGTYYMYAEIAETDDHVAVTTAPVEFEIGIKEVTEPTIVLDPASFIYDGNECVPTVTVKDGDVVIDESEYTAEFTENIEPGDDTATVTITDVEGGNYTVSGSKTFSISKATNVPTVTMEGYTCLDEPSVPQIVNNVSGGDVTFYYNTTNSNVGGTEWKDITGETLDGGTYYMYATIEETDHYFAATTDPVEFVVSKIDIEPTVELEDWTYGDEANTPVVTGNTDNGEESFVYYTDEDCTVKTTAADNGAAEEGGVPTFAGTYYVELTVDETAHYAGATATCSFEIAKKDPVKGEDFDIVVADLNYNGQPQELLSITTADGSDIEVKLTYSQHGLNELKELPKQIAVDTYHIYYKVIGDKNYNDLDWTTESIDIEIKPAVITVSGIEVKDKTYDATTDGTCDYTNVVLDNLVEGEDLKVTATATFADKNVGEDKEVTLSELTLSGTNVGNYVLAEEGQQTTATATISQKQVTVTEIAVAPKTYDGTNVADFIFDDTLIDGLIEGDDVAVSATGTFDGVDIGNGLTVTIDEITLTGEDAGNYVLTVDGNQTEATGDIVVRPVTITANDQSCKVGEALATGIENVTVTGLAENEELTSIQLDANKVTENAGTINVSDAVIKNGDKVVTSNYKITYKAGVLEYTTLEPSVDTAPSAAGITYGETLADSELTGGVVKYGEDEVAGTFAWADDTIAPSVADSNVTEYEVVFTPEDENTYSPVSCMIKIEVAKADPECTAPTGLMATYGDTLADVEITQPENGTWTFADDTLSVGEVGTNTFKATFTPDDTENYNTIENVDVAVKVAVADLTVDTAPEASDITYGETLADSELTNGVVKFGEVTVEGTFAWADDTIAPVVADSETTEYDVIFTPADDSFNPVTLKVTVVVDKADPEATAPTGLTATVGQTLADVIIAQPENGTWAFVEPATSVGSEGTNTFKATFTPADTDNYNTLENVDVEVSVAYANCKIKTVPTAAKITYGETLADSALTGGLVMDGAEDVAGTFTWADDTIAPSVADSKTTEYIVVFTPASDTYVPLTCKVTVEVEKADPEYTVPEGLTAIYGQTLADVEFTQPEEGTWSFANTNVNVGAVGTNTFKAVFTPADTDNYNVLTGIEVTVTVGKADVTVAKAPTASGIIAGQTLAESTLTGGTVLCGSEYVSGTFAWADDTIAPTAADSNKTEYEVIFTPDNTDEFVPVTCKVTLAVAEPTPVPTATATPAPTATATPKPTATATPKPTATTAPTATPEPTATTEPKVTATPTPTATPKPEVKDFVERLYGVALGRESDEEGLDYWVDQVKKSGMTGGDLAKNFLFSDEFISKNVSNEDFVETLYKTFFDRESEADGKAYWVGQLKSDAMDKKTVIEGFINSDEWATLCTTYGIPSGGTGKSSVTIEPNEQIVAFATRLYTTCLGREPEADGLKYWSEELANFRVSGTNAALGFFFSDEFVGKNFSNEEYVKRLYLTFMDREYEQEGFDYWVGQLNSGAATRVDVFNGFSVSPEFGNICASYGIIR